MINFKLSNEINPFFSKLLFFNAVYQVTGNKPVQPVMHNIAIDQEQESKNLDISFNAGEVVNSLIRKGSEE